METSEIKRIGTRNIKLGMVLAEDVVTPNGQLLIPQGTEISENHLFRMNLYQITHVKIYSADLDTAEDDSAESLDDDLEFMPDTVQSSDRWLNRTESFLRFNKLFGKVEVVVREQFDALTSGEPVNQEKLLTSTQTLMNSVRLKSDLFSYMNHLRADDEHTYVHSINVAILCNIFGQWLKYSEKDTQELTLSGLLHDIGKLKIPKALLDKPEPLSPEEFDRIKDHSELGYQMIQHLDTSQRVKDGVRLHHERNDGSGYPLGLVREDIPDFAKIIAIADVYSAMTCGRSYHKKFSPFRVIQLFEQESFGYLDTKYLLTFLENIAHYYLGEKVRLTNGTVGKIVFIHNQSPSRPIIQAGEEMIDLHTDHTLDIEEII